MGKGSTDYIRHTCPAAETARDVAVLQVQRIIAKRIEGPESQSIEDEIDQVVQELHDVNLKLRENLRDALECACADLEDARGERDTADEHAQQLQADVDSERERADEEANRADAAEREASELRRELERVKGAAAQQEWRAKAGLHRW